MLVRGPFTVNIIMMATGGVEKREFAEHITGKILSIDQLMRLTYTQAMMTSQFFLGGGGVRTPSKS
jgi:hypothetical protein